MNWRPWARRFLLPYRYNPTLIRRKAEFSVLASAFLVVIFSLHLGLLWFLRGDSWLLGIQALCFIALMAVGVFLFLSGRLEGQVNILALLCLAQCLLFFGDEVSRQFFVLCLFSMFIFAVLAIRPYQRVFSYVAFPFLAAAKGGYEFFQAGQGLLSRNTGEETIFTLLVFLAAIPLVQFLIGILGREIHHSEYLLGVNKDLKREAGTDRLTGTWNRRHFDLLARKETGEALRTGHPLALAILDLDRFKQVNDRYGHQAGDEVLTVVVHTIMDILRRGDSLIRWGGDEFVVLCPGVGTTEVRALGEKILEAIHRHPLLHTRGVGISVGIAVWHPGETMEELLNRADGQLYRAKNTGRNRICFEDGIEGSCVE